MYIGGGIVGTLLPHCLVGAKSVARRAGRTEPLAALCCAGTPMQIKAGRS
jgi:hypothetical protein